jgi:membrane-bound lytic murein transglycosylase D
VTAARLRGLAAGLPALLLAACASTPPVPASTPLALPVSEPVQVSALPPLPPPEPPPPPARLRDGAAVFERLRAGLDPPACVRGERNRQWRRRFTAQPEAFEAQLERGLPLLGWVVEAVEQRGLPMQFALIPIVESGLRPEARGRGGPLGLWQIMPATARQLGLRVGGQDDERLSPWRSTTAALDYLQALQADFGGWRATAMAYNAGRGRLRRAFAHAGDRAVSAERRRPPGLSPITYHYVAKLEALSCLVAEPARHGLRLPTAAFEPLPVPGPEEGGPG